MLDYIKKNKNISFEENPFNEVDMGILSQFIYLPYKSDTYVKEYLESIDLDKASDYKERCAFFTKDILKELKTSTRYNDIFISDVLDILDFDKEKQLFACTYHLGDKHIVTFRGTDKYLMSWKEDLYLSFENEMPSHKDALDYVKKAIKNYKDIYLNGHSKGGNHALYAAFKLKSKHIKHVYLFDSPGFLDLKRVDNMTLFVPETSVFGMMMNKRSDMTCVKSTAPIFMSHLLNSWEVYGNHFKKGSLSGFSKNFHKTNEIWLNKTSRDDREIITEGFFKSLKAEKDAKVTPKMMPSYIMHLFKGIMAIKNLDKSDKEFITENFNIFTESIKLGIKK